MRTPQRRQQEGERRPKTPLSLAPAEVDARPLPGDQSDHEARGEARRVVGPRCQPPSSSARHEGRGTSSHDSHAAAAQCNHRSGSAAPASSLQQPWHRRTATRDDTSSCTGTPPLRCRSPRATGIASCIAVAPPHRSSQPRPLHRADDPPNWGSPRPHFAGQLCASRTSPAQPNYPPRSRPA